MMKSKKIAQLILLGLGILFFGFLSIGLILIGTKSNVNAGTVFLIPTLIFFVCFVAVLFDKGHSTLFDTSPH